MEKMQLIRFRVTDFRSVKDSGWIETDDITSLIGVNESGKTNLLLPLWKLKPAKDGEINLMADAPRKRYNEIKNMDVKPVFIEAHFFLPDDLVSELVGLTGATPDDVRIASVSRRLDGSYVTTFPNATLVRSLPKTEVETVVARAHTEVEALTPAAKADDPVKEAMLTATAEALTMLSGVNNDELDQRTLGTIQTCLRSVDTTSASKRSTLVPRFGQLLDAIDDMCRRRNASGRCADVKLIHPMPLPPLLSLPRVPVARASATRAP